ncbi:MAG: hypothetical protein IKC77_00655 [Lentisphaeria bacterium]|nr:hypothetical protein [Lentisphaeria bacterium]
MRKAIRNIFAALLLLFISGLSAVEVSLVASNALNVSDMFSGLPAHRTPAIPELTAVRPGHKFNIYILLSKIQTQKGKAHVTGSMYLKSGEKKTELFKNQELFYGECFAPTSINLSNLVANWDFSSDDPEGKHTFVIEVKDMVNGFTKTAELDIKLIHKPLTPLKINTNEIRGFISTFYKAPQPERLPELFNIFLSGDAAARKNKNYSPLPLLYGMAKAIEQNPFVWKEFAALSPELETDHKKYLALLFAAVGSDAMKFMIKNADRKTAGYLKQMQANNPWQFNEPYPEEDINAFWMEFYFTGKPEPILKIANQLRNRPTMTPEQAKKRKGELSPAEKNRLRNYYSASSAAWSLNLNAARHNLVFFYLEGMLDKGDFADTTTAAKIQKILLRTAAEGSGSK